MNFDIGKLECTLIGHICISTLKESAVPQLVHLPYLFQSMAHGLVYQQFRSYKDIEKWLDSWIASEDEHLYRNGIRALPERWEKVVANDGQYFE